MADTQGPPGDEAPPPDANRNEQEWSRWERQKLDVYRQEHPEPEPAAQPSASPSDTPDEVA